MHVVFSAYLCSVITQSSSTIHFLTPKKRYTTMGQIQFSKVARKNLQDPTEPQKTYAMSQSRGIITIDKLAKHMAMHGSAFSRGTISAILTDACDHVRELICDGNIVNLGDLATFNVKLRSTGVCESVEDEDTGKKPVFTAADITGVEVKFTPGEGFAKMLDDCEFVEVESLEKKQQHLTEKKKALADGTWKPNGESGSGGTNEHE